jgi:hypothetical protein
MLLLLLRTQIISTIINSSFTSLLLIPLYIAAAAYPDHTFTITNGSLTSLLPTPSDAAAAAYQITFTITNGSITV